MARTRAITILFVDLVASTERRARLGDDRFDEFTARFVAVLRAAIAAHNGREVKTAGDGLMVVFPESVADAITCAGEMHAAVAALDEDDDPPLVRVGISTGEVAEDGGDYQGMPIVEAARLEAAAQPGQTLTTAIVRSLVGTRRGLRFRDIGALTLKGLPAPLPTVEVVDDEMVVVTPATGSSAAAPRRRWPAVVAVLAAAVVLIAGAAVFVSTRDSGPTSTSAITGITPPIGYTPTVASAGCPDEVSSVSPETTCAQLTVPQDRSAPHGQQIKLLVTRSPARTVGTAADPTIDLCGCENPANSVARDHAELVHLATRGFFGTEPSLECPSVAAARRDSLTKPSDDRAANDKVAAEMRTCRAQLIARGIDPNRYNFNEAALDVIDLMVALNIKRADFVAHGDTDFIAFGVLRRAPAAVRTMTLDNPPPPGESDLSSETRDRAAAFGRYASLCSANAVCASSYPDLDGTWKASAQSARTSPAVVVGSADDPRAPQLPVLLDQPRLADALADAFTVSDTYPFIPAVLTEKTPDPIVANTLLQNDDFLWDDQAPWGGLLSYSCSYHARTVNSTEVALTARTYPDFVGERNSHWADWCAAWPVDGVTDTLSVDVASSVPAFIFRGDVTPIGTSDWMHSLLRGLPNGTGAIFPTLGEDLLATGPPCLSDLRRKFLADPTAPLDTAACVAQSPPIQFTAPG